MYIHLAKSPQYASTGFAADVISVILMLHVTSV